MNIQNSIYQRRIRRLQESSPVKHAVINKMNEEDPDNPYIHLINHGGVRTLNTLKKEIQQHLDEYSKQVKKGKYEGLAAEFTQEYGSVLKEKVLGLAEIELQMKDPKIKRKIKSLKNKKR